MKAGVSTARITPGEPMWLAGWAARRAPASGAGLDLFAKALALEDTEGNRFVILTADLIAIPFSLASAVAARCPVPRAQILFNASHTHCGPEVRPDKAPFFEIPAEFAAKILPYVSSLETTLVRIIQEALASLAPAALEVCQTSANFARNRRAAGGPVSRDVPVLKILRPNRQPLAILFGYACHNLTLPPAYCQYHSDYAGIAQQILEKTFPGATAFFLAGAGADQDPEPRGTLELTEEHGRALARSVGEGVAAAGRPVEDSLTAAFEEVLLDFLPVPAAKILEEEARSQDLPRARKAKYLLAQKAHPSSYPCAVQVVRFGKELLLVALGGEPDMEYDVRLKSEFRGPMTWVCGYSNDMFGYLPSRRLQKEGGYEGDRSLLWSALPAAFTASVEDRIFSSVRRLAGTLDIPKSNG